MNKRIIKRPDEDNRIMHESSFYSEEERLHKEKLEEIQQIVQDYEKLMEKIYDYVCEKMDYDQWEEFQMIVEEIDKQEKLNQLEFTQEQKKNILNRIDEGIDAQQQLIPETTEPLCKLFSKTLQLLLNSNFFKYPKDKRDLIECMIDKQMSKIKLTFREKQKLATIQRKLNTIKEKEKNKKYSKFVFDLFDKQFKT